MACVLPPPNAARARSLLYLACWGSRRELNVLRGGQRFLGLRDHAGKRESRLVAPRPDLEAVRRARDPERSVLEDVGVDHRGLEIAMAEQLLDGADVGPVLEQMRCERVAEGV